MNIGDTAVICCVLAFLNGLSHAKCKVSTSLTTWWSCCKNEEGHPGGEENGLRSTIPLHPLEPPCYPPCVTLCKLGGGKVGGVGGTSHLSLT